VLVLTAVWLGLILLPLLPLLFALSTPHPLQLEMEYIFNSLEEEALEISADELRNNMKGEQAACVWWWWWWGEAAGTVRHVSALSRGLWRRHRMHCGS
jgi:hypothetical protein